jgi:hypothetical protein
LNDQTTAVPGAPDDELSRRAPPPLPPEQPPTRDEVRAMLRDAVLDATVPILQRLRALEEEIRARGSSVPRRPTALPASAAANGIAVPVASAAPGTASMPARQWHESDGADEREFARAFNGGRRRKQMAWILGLLALLAVASAVIGAIASNVQ